MSVESTTFIYSLPINCFFFKWIEGYVQGGFLVDIVQVVYMYTHINLIRVIVFMKESKIQYCFRLMMEEKNP